MYFTYGLGALLFDQVWADGKKMMTTCDQLPHM